MSTHETTRPTVRDTAASELDDPGFLRLVLTYTATNHTPRAHATFIPDHSDTPPF